MINTFFIGDTHFFHKNIMKFEPVFRPFSTMDEHNEVLVNRWNSVVKPNDIVWHLGDVVFGCAENLAIMDRLNGKKKLVLGNHDRFEMTHYMKYFTHIYGVAAYQGFVLTHIPVADSQFWRYKGNIHGHIHSRTMDDPRYINVSVEAINLTPINFEELSDNFYDKLFSDEFIDTLRFKTKEVEVKCTFVDCTNTTIMFYKGANHAKIVNVA